MDLEEFLGQENINNFEKLLLVYLQFRSFKSYKDLEPVFKVSGVTIRKAIANLRKLGLLNNYDPVKLSFRCKEIFTHENEECKENFTYKNDTCKENLTPCKEMFTSDSDRCKEKFTSCKENFTFSKNDPYIYNTNSININISNINKEEGKSSLTSFASTSLKYYIGKFNFVNDLDHRNINQIQNSLIPTEPAKTSLKAPATQKKPRKTKAPFQPPTYDMVLGFMAAYVHQEQNNFPELIEINLNIEAKKYMNFYSGKDWRLGVIRMTDWRIQASNWLMGKVERITEGKIKIKKNQQYIQEAFGDSFLNSQNIVDLNQVQNADGTITAETPAIQTSFPVFQQTKTKEQLKKETDDFIQKHKSGEVL